MNKKMQQKQRIALGISILVVLAITAILLMQNNKSESHSTGKIISQSPPQQLQQTNRALQTITTEIFADSNHLLNVKKSTNGVLSYRAQFTLDGFPLSEKYLSRAGIILYEVTYGYDNQGRIQNIQDNDGLRKERFRFDDIKYPSLPTQMEMTLPGPPQIKSYIGYQYSSREDLGEKMAQADVYIGQTLDVLHEKIAKKDTVGLKFIDLQDAPMFPEDDRRVSEETYEIGQSGELRLKSLTTLKYKTIKTRIALTYILNDKIQEAIITRDMDNDGIPEETTRRVYEYNTQGILTGTTDHFDNGQTLHYDFQYDSSSYDPTGKYSILTEVIGPKGPVRMIHPSQLISESSLFPFI